MMFKQVLFNDFDLMLLSGLKKWSMELLLHCFIQPYDDTDLCLSKAGQNTQHNRYQMSESRWNIVIFNKTEKLETRSKTGTGMMTRTPGSGKVLLHEDWSTTST